MSNATWHPQCDWQLGHIDGAWVVVARGGCFSSRRTEHLPLRVVATCKDDIDAERIVAALRFTANSDQAEDA